MTPSSTLTSNSTSTAPRPYGVVPAPRQILWHGTEIYSIVHFSLNTFSDKEWGYGDDSPGIFNPTAFDAEQWARVCQESGIRGLILVCKHHDGFCLWPTRTTDYCIRNSPWKDGQGDMVAEVFAACRKYGLKCGAYLSPWDRNDADYWRAAYIARYHLQLEELLTGYGPLFEIWFDGANGGDGYYRGARERRSIDPGTYYQWDVIEAMVRRYQPEACIFNLLDIRYVGNESGVADETCWATQTYTGTHALQQSSYPPGTGHRNGDCWMPAECDFPLRKGWFYHLGDRIRQPADLFEAYLTSVGRGGTMNIGLAPDRRGLLHDDDIAALHGWKALMDKTFQRDLLSELAATDGASDLIVTSASNVRDNDPRYAPACVLDGNDSTYWTTDDSEAVGGAGGAPQPALVFEFARPLQFNVLSIREHLPLGQRVDHFAADVWDEAEAAWKEAGSATSIGHKRVLFLRSNSTTRFRLRFTGCSACPAIQEVSLYRAPSSVILRGKLDILRDRDGFVHIRTSNTGLTIRYTTDGSEPAEDSADSAVYTAPFRFPHSGSIRACGFVDASDDEADMASARTSDISATFGVDRSTWHVVSVSLDSPYTNGGAAGVSRLLDDDPDTYWHTWHKDKMQSAPPHHVVLDMGRLHQVIAFTRQPRRTTGTPEAIPDKYEFHLSPDGTHWSLAASGEFANIKASPVMQLITLAKPMTGRFLRFVALHVIDNGNYVAVASLGVIEG